MAMLGAEHVAALACILHCTNPLVAIPALVFVTLNKGKLAIKRENSLHAEIKHYLNFGDLGRFRLLRLILFNWAGQC